MECFQIIRQLRDECGWPDDQVFAYIPRCKIEGVFYKRLTNFSKMIGMSAALFNTYKSKHNCRDIIETLQKIQKDRIPTYQTECGLIDCAPGGARFQRVQVSNPPGSGKDIADGKGVHREVESE